MKWVKLHVSLLKNVNYRRLSIAGKITFLTALMLAGDCDNKGLLAVRTGPLTVKEVALETSLPPRQQAAALQELCAAAFLSMSLDGAYLVERWDEKVGSDSERLSNAERQRRHRNAKRNASNANRNAQSNVSNEKRNVTKSNEKVTDIEEELEIPLPPSGGYPPNARNFADLEPDVATHLELAAAENRTGKISAARTAGMRAALGAVLDECADREAFAAGLRESNAKGVANANYVRRCVRSAMERAGLEPIPKRRAAAADQAEQWMREQDRT